MQQTRYIHVPWTSSRTNGKPDELQGLPYSPHRVPNGERAGVGWPGGAGCAGVKERD